MKKTISIILTLIYVLSFSIIAFAADTKVSAENVNIPAGETFEITYSISGNSGIMGFAFELYFDGSAFEVISVEKSSTLAGGMFNDSIKASTKDNFKIVWSNTENFYGDIELFSVTFKAKEDAYGKYDFELKSLKDDTFNENWDDVKISCDTVQVSVSNDAKMTFWDKVVNFFKKVINFIISIFK